MQTKPSYSKAIALAALAPHKYLYVHMEYLATLFDVAPQVVLMDVETYTRKNKCPQ